MTRSGRNPGALAALCVLLLALCAGAAPAHAAHAAAPFEDSMAQRLLACTGCHGENGRALGNVYFPRLAGKPAGYLLNQLRNFRDGRRQYALMAGMVDLLSDSYLQEIAHYFSELVFPYPAPAPLAMAPAQRARAQALVQHGDPARRLPACTSCHGPALTGLAPHVPGLLGLPRDYINAQLGAWQTGQRHAVAPDCMADVAQALSAGEVADLSAWLSAQALPPDTRAGTTVPVLRGAARRPACGSAPELGANTP